ncbi:uncharacterized protein A4U43_C01F18060 [Asparagus officinalis]|uniref:Uncharacterized protein n=1 Tax=Asparagus officinalis TaxID=4686 RepID=A0A5P1FUY0_ASPOF|nr:uncharacterized protein A4U43_C01F18060 [Asparagus officinalis]
MSCVRVVVIVGIGDDKDLIDGPTPTYDVTKHGNLCVVLFKCSEQRWMPINTNYPADAQLSEDMSADPVEFQTSLQVDTTQIATKLSMTGDSNFCMAVQFSPIATPVVKNEE